MQLKASPRGSSREAAGFRASRRRAPRSSERSPKIVVDFRARPQGSSGRVAEFKGVAAELARRGR
eukprot:6191358-Alexandrium_andersonii.AAC.1